MTIIPFGDWLPDQPPINGSGATIVKNAVPKVEGYSDLDTLTAFTTNGLDNECLGGLACIDKAANSFMYLGDAAKLYVIASSAFVDKSKVGGYAVALLDRWEMVCWNQQLFATNIIAPVQEITLGGAIFADLITSTAKPKARHMGIVRDFLVLGNINDLIDGDVPNRVAWSAANNPTDFDPSPTTLAGRQNLNAEGGWVQKVIGGSFGTIFQERAITRMSFIGSPIKFQFDTIEEKRGALAPGGVVKFGTGVFYIAEDGIFFFDGAQSRPIGAGKVNKFFFDQLDLTNKHKITSAIDFEESLVVWAYPSTSGGGLVDRLLFYNWVADRFAEAEVTTQHLMTTVSEGFTLEGLDAVSASLDALGPSLDSRIWAGGGGALGAVDATKKLATFDGDALTATFETAEHALGSDRRGRARKAMIQTVRPLIDPSEEGLPVITVRLNSRNRTDENPVLGPAVSLNAIGEARPRSSARLNRFRVEVAGGFNNAVGVDVTSRRMGIR